MRIHPLGKIEQLKELRKKGCSINELVRKFEMPKTTVWHHTHRVKIPLKYIKILKAKQGGSKARTKIALEKASIEALEIVSGSNKYHCALLAMLYWAEGNSKNEFTFTNTNPQMVRVFINILRKYFNIKNKRLSIAVRYFTGMNHKKCLNHWSKITRIPKKEVRMYYNDGGKNGRSPYGMCRITVRKGSYLLKVIHSLIQNIANEVNAPIAQLD